MFNVCARCGIYSVEKTVDPEGPNAICPSCGYRQPFLRLPLYRLTGASGTGKSTICLRLAPELPECVVLESDILWRPEFDQPTTNWHDYHNLWLRLVKNIAQGGRPVVLCGTALPEQLGACPERRYIGDIDYLALVCDDDELAERLRARPAWRSSDSSFIAHMVGFNRWLKENAEQLRPGVTLFDTSDRTVAESVTWVKEWVRHRLGRGTGDSSISY